MAEESFGYRAAIADSPVFGKMRRRRFSRRRILFLSSTAGVLLLFLILAGCAHGSFGDPEGFMEAVPPEWTPGWSDAAPGVSYLSREASDDHPAFHLLRVDLQNPHTAIEVPESVPRGLELSRLRGGVAVDAGVSFTAGLSVGQGFSFDAGITFQPRLNNFPSTDGRLVALWNGGPFEYRYEGGKRLMDPVGIWIEEGKEYSSQEHEWGILEMIPGSGLQVRRGYTADPSAQWAVGGYLPILREGENIGIHGERHARTAVGISKDGQTLYVCLVEGERLFRPGLTSKETAHILRAAGAWDGLNLDGGNSSFLLLRGYNSAAGKSSGDGPDENSGVGKELVFYSGGRERLPCFMAVVVSD